MSRPLELAPPRSSSSPRRRRRRHRRRVARRPLPNRVPSRPSRALQALPRQSRRRCSAQPRRPPPRARATYPVLVCPLSRLNNNNSSSKLRLPRRRLPRRLEPSRRRRRSRPLAERGPLRGRNNSNSSSKEPRRRAALAPNHQRQRQVDPVKRMRNRSRQGRARVPARTPSSSSNSRNPHRLRTNRTRNAWGRRYGPRPDEEAHLPSRRRRRRRRRLLLLLPLLPFNRIRPRCPPLPMQLLRRPSLHANRHRCCQRLRRPLNRRSRR